MAQTTTTNLGDKLKEISIVDTIIDGRKFKPDGFINKFNILKVDGPVKVLAEAEAVVAGIYGEMETISTSNDNVVNEFQLNPNKRVARTIEVSEQFLNDSAIGYENYVADLIAGSIGRTIEKQITLDGYTGAVDPKKLQRLHVTDVQTAVGTSATSLSINEVKAKYISMIKNKTARDCFWLFNIDSMLSVTDSLGNEYMKFEDVPEGADATLLGLPVYFATLGDTTDAKITRAIIVNPTAYTIAMKDLTIEVIEGDTIQSLRRSKVIKGEIYVDAVVTNSYGRLLIAQAS
ncbi:phage major capsid protein [Bacillus sp. AFS002410]|uniref:phage major capsid protein n=1 Tax=Bacillus sp. AFS002410 TaxID=2033481 RepID=UPI000BF240E0|nr:phage major capsid protein [Bacillus sp. AFS002410]PEJ57059.1 phage major capsid protein [Bacillus sp. AFS002410]